MVHNYTFRYTYRMIPHGSFHVNSEFDAPNNSSRNWSTMLQRTIRPRIAALWNFFIGFLLRARLLFLFAMPQVSCRTHLYWLIEAVRLAYLGLSWLISSRRIIFILPVEYYSFCQPNTSRMSCAVSRKPGSINASTIAPQGGRGSNDAAAARASDERKPNEIHLPSQNICTFWLLRITFDHSSYLKYLRKYKIIMIYLKYIRW
jgi:hypothetical protein